jgi:hypothetical protein
LPKPLISADAGNPTDNTNMEQTEGDISEFGSELGKIFFIFSDFRIQIMLKTWHMRPDSVRVAS